jgi:hypothetical protein
MRLNARKLIRLAWRPACRRSIGCFFKDGLVVRLSTAPEAASRQAAMSQLLASIMPLSTTSRISYEWRGEAEFPPWSELFSSRRITPFAIVLQFGNHEYCPSSRHYSQYFEDAVEHIEYRPPHFGRYGFNESWRKPCRARSLRRNERIFT